MSEKLTKRERQKMNLDALIKQEFSGAAAKEIILNVGDLEIVLTKESNTPYMLMLVYRTSIVIGWSIIEL